MFYHLFTLVAETLTPCDILTILGKSKLLRTTTGGVGSVLLAVLITGSYYIAACGVFHVQEENVVYGMLLAGGIWHPIVRYGTIRHSLMNR